MSVVDAPDWGFKHCDFIVYQASGQWKIKFVTRFEANNGIIETWGLTYDMKHGDGDKWREERLELEWLTESFTDSLNSDKWRFATAFEVEAFWNASKGGSYNIYAGFYDYLHGRREEWKKVHFDKGLAIPDTDDWISPSKWEYEEMMKWVKFPEKAPEFPVPEKAPERGSLLPVDMKPFKITNSYETNMDNALDMLIANLTDNYDCLSNWGRSKDAAIIGGILKRLEETLVKVEEGTQTEQVLAIKPNTLFYFEERQILYEYLFYHWENDEIMLYGNCLDLETNDWLHPEDHALQGMAFDHFKKLVPANHEQQDFYYKAMTWAVEFDRLIYDVKVGDTLIDPVSWGREICTDHKLAIEAVKEGILEMLMPYDFDEKQAGNIEYEYDFVRNTLENRPIPIQ